MYASCYVAVFLNMHSKGPEISYGATAKVCKQVKRYSDLKKLHKNEYLPDRVYVQQTTTKKDRVDLGVFENKSSLSLRGGQAVLCKKYPTVS